MHEKYREATHTRLVLSTRYFPITVTTSAGGAETSLPKNGKRKQNQSAGASAAAEGRVFDDDDDVYYYICQRLKLKEETENMITGR